MKKPIKPLAELLDSVRNIEGFPIGKDEDILALSNPPYYTACPNPYIKDFIEEHGKKYDEETDDYKREPYVGDVSEGKTSPVYMAHTYHTKVPHEAISKYILHYTNQNDIVFDGFCGTGMTGVAANECERYCILSDLSPIASLIAANLNTRVDSIEFSLELDRILKKARDEFGWMYKTSHKKDLNATVNYIIWSDILLCP